MDNIFDQFDGKANVFDKFDEEANVFDQFKEPKKTDDTMEWKDVLVQGISNLPSSAAKLGTDVVNMLSHPIRTAKGAAKLIAGGTAKVFPGEGQEEVEAPADFLIDFYKKRYGSVENLKKTLAEDPVGVFADAATIAIPGGAVAKGVGATAKIKSLATAGQVIQKTGAIADPITAVVTGAKAASKLIPKTLPSKLYQSAVKFSKVIPETKRMELIKTGLKNKIMPTVDGLQRLEVNINGLNTKITNLLDTATKEGKLIPVKALFSHLKELRRATLKLSTEPLKDLRAIDNISKQIGMANKMLKRKSLTPIEAQKIKQAIYRENSKLYSKITQTPVKGKTKMAIARAAKESLENIFPEIKRLNKREGVLLELNKEIEKAASRISNRDIIGIGSPIKAHAGKAIAGAPGAAVGALSSILDFPRVKAKLAIVGHHLKNKEIKINQNSAFYTLGLLTTERIGLNELDKEK